MPEPPSSVSPAQSSDSVPSRSAAEGPSASSSNRRAFQAGWPWVMCVIGLDYLSTLAYQPSIAFGAAGRLAPLVTVLVAAATLFLALPVYWYIAGRSPLGGGSAALLERLIPGWFGKLLVLILLSFGSVDLVFTRTFSAADAAEHLTHSPFPAWQEGLNAATHEGEQLRRSLPPTVQARTEGLWNRQMVVTLVVLALSTGVGLVFFRGYTSGFIRVAVAVVAIYLAMTLIVVGSGAIYLIGHAHLLSGWWADVWAGNWHTPGPEGPVHGWADLALTAVGLFPYLALGLSGFEFTLMAMPLVRGRADDEPAYPRGRIRNTRVLLTIAAATMSVYLLASTLLTTILLPPTALTTDGQARYRALAYLAHGGALVDGTPVAAVNPLFGLTFGTAYDVATVAILALAGLSFALTLSQWIPPYLQRLGMEFNWSVRFGVLVYLFTGAKFAITVFYGADVDAHRAAYLTSVLAVFAFAALAAAVDVWQQRHRLGWRRVFRVPPLFLLAGLVFAGSGLLVGYQRPVGAALAVGFIVVVLVVSMVSRAWRCTEFRFGQFEFADKATADEWQKLKETDFPILVPTRAGCETIIAKEIEVRARHRLPGTVPIVFVMAEMGDPSEFAQSPKLRIARENGRVVIHITRCASIPHAIASAALELSSAGAVPEVHFGWSNENPVTANLHFVLFGHGNVPWMVHTLIRRAPVPNDRKPRVIVA